MSIKLKLEGFENLLNDIQKAGGTIDRATESCMKQSAQIMQEELKSQMEKADVDSDLIRRMPSPTFEKEGNRSTARVGYKMGSYNPADPSDGFKVVFANYGTPHRKKHGKQPKKGFIAKAKKKASAPIKKAQRATLEKILGRLKSK